MEIEMLAVVSSVILFVSVNVVVGRWDPFAISTKVSYVSGERFKSAIVSSIDSDWKSSISGLGGLCQLICIDALIKENGRRFRCRFSSGSQRWGHNLPPTLESSLHLLTIGGRGELAPADTPARATPRDTGGRLSEIPFYATMGTAGCHPRCGTVFLECVTICTGGEET